jgi:hypothetical protein
MLLKHAVRAGSDKEAQELAICWAMDCLAASDALCAADMHVGVQYGVLTFQAYAVDTTIALPMTRNLSILEEIFIFLFLKKHNKENAIILRDTAQDPPFPQPNS